MLKLILILVAAYALLVLLLYLVQDTLVFPGAGHGDRGLPLLPRMESGLLRRPGGQTFRIATLRSEPVRAVVVMFPGNGEDLHSAAWQGEVLARHGLLVVAVEYPGYGASEGKPGVAAILEVAEAAAEFAAERAAQLGVPLFAAGSSLGSFPAVHVAARRELAGLLLRAPATTLAAAAGSHYWWLPVGMLLRHGFDNLAAAPRVGCPVLIVHGTDDTVVPAALGEELAAALPRATFVAVPGHGHNDLDWSPSGPVGERVGAFFAGR